MPERGTSTRGGRLPDPRLSLAIGIMENRRLLRKLRGQDLWLGILGIGIVFLVLAMPTLFEYTRGIGTGVADGDGAILTSLDAFIAVSWVSLVALGLFSGVTAEGELTDQDVFLAIRPPKDVAGGLVAYVLLGYSPIAIGIGLVAGAGLAVGANTPFAIVGILLASCSMLVTGVLVGYVLGLVLKGVIRRSPWLTRLKPVIGAGVVVGYVWLSFTGRFWQGLADVGSALAESPIRWYGDLALLWLPGVDVSLSAAVGMLALALVALPLGSLAVASVGEFAWYVDRSNGGEGGSASPSTIRPTARIDAILRHARVSAATRGVALTVLVRGYRAPLQLVYTTVPLLFLIPVLDTIVRTGDVPAWFPWMVMAYGGWAAGVSFPLNILGTQGRALPRILTSPAKGSQLVHGYVLATAIVFVPLTVALGTIAGHLAGRSWVWLLVFALGGAAIVGVASVLSAGIGTLFPRFSSVELTENTDVQLPSKVAFFCYSIIAVILVNAVGVVADETFRMVVSALLSTHLPFDLAITAERLHIASGLVLGGMLVATPLLYLLAVRRIEGYRIS